MKDFHEFLHKMGGMHDSIVAALYWFPGEKMLEFHFQDIYSNFEGLPEYPGLQPGVITLYGVSYLSISLETYGHLSVFELLPDKHEPNILLATFSPNGKIRARFSNAVYPVCRLIE
jgi:hypothetical protein